VESQVAVILQITWVVQKQSNNVITYVNGDTEAVIGNYVSVLNRDNLSQATFLQTDEEEWSQLE
jgi:hypothetical protein